MSRSDSARGAESPGAVAGGPRSPRLLPLLTRLQPSNISVAAPGSVALIVDGIRLLLHVDGSFQLADGIFPLARSVSVTPLPQRLGGQLLFSACRPEDCWLMQAESFVGTLSPLGTLDVPVSAIVPGFEAIYATLSNSGIVVAIDPKGGRASEPRLLPAAPEYGPIVVVDDWYGAAIDPLRGLMTTQDAGAHWQPPLARAPSDASTGWAAVSQQPVRSMHAASGELFVDLGTAGSFVFSRRGDVREAEPEQSPRYGSVLLPLHAANAAQAANRAGSRNAVAAGANRVPGVAAIHSGSRAKDAEDAQSKRAAESERSAARLRALRQWFRRWEMGPIGSWPIELAITRGALTRHTSNFDGSSREASSREASSREASSREASSREASSRKASSREASSREASSREASSREASSREASSREASSREASNSGATETKSNLEAPRAAAAARGASTSGDVATVITRGLIAEIRLRDGRILATEAVDIAPDRSCTALQAEAETYFYCSSATASSLHRLVAPHRLERMGEFFGLRELIGLSSAGVLLRGTCDALTKMQVGSYCALRHNQPPQSIQLELLTGRERPLLRDDGAVAVLVPPTPKHAGRIRSVNPAHPDLLLELPADIAPRQRRLLTQGLWLERPTLVDGVVASWVVLGDELLGVHIAPSGALRVGDVMSGASRALFNEDRVLIPDSSGYASESVDGGMTILRPHLPIATANTLGVIPKTTQQYGCSRVGCLLGDWLRLGWSEPKHVAHAVALEQLNAPEPLRLTQRRRRVPRLRCAIDTSHVSAPASARRLPTEAASTAATRPGRGQLSRVTDAATTGVETLHSTAFTPFYSTLAPPLSSTWLGFDRSWRDERLALHGYASAPSRSGKLDSWQLVMRLSDPLHRDQLWSVAGAGIPFDSAESVARAFAHPRYGEHASNWSIVLDPGGDGALWSIEDHGTWRVFLLEPNRPITALSELAGRAPRRISDMARLRDGWYFLGTEPNPQLIAFVDGSARVVSDFDPRSRLLAARLRMVKNRDKTRLAYLALSARLRSADVQWFLYPVNTSTGGIEAPVVIPLERGIRPCDKSEDGWLFEASSEVIADVELTVTQREVQGRTQLLLLLSESGVCIDRLLVNGVEPHAAKGVVSAPVTQTDVKGSHWDEMGRLRAVNCEIVEAGGA